MPDQFEGRYSGQAPAGGRVLTDAEAGSACGPAAAVAFARANGRNPTLREAVDLAASQVNRQQNYYWDAQGGMHGVGRFSEYLNAMGVPHQLAAGAPDWNAVAQAANGGHLVAISTPNHYFVVQGYNAQTGQFYVGSSGTAMRGGAPWSTAQQLLALGGGTPDGVVYGR